MTDNESEGDRLTVASKNIGSMENSSKDARLRPLPMDQNSKREQESLFLEDGLFTMVNNSQVRLCCTTSVYSQSNFPASKEHSTGKPILPLEDQLNWFNWVNMAAGISGRLQPQQGKLRQMKEDKTRKSGVVGLRNSGQFREVTQCERVNTPSVDRVPSFGPYQIKKDSPTVIAFRNLTFTSRKAYSTAVTGSAACRPYMLYCREKDRMQR
ncbi:hypothetical protein DFH06DRAFT_1139349 [Mycena polygramma]|nr:hypothetical protein DFH06DRAFT_1139349 [Mycena polygramma]